MPEGIVVDFSRPPGSAIACHNSLPRPPLPLSAIGDELGELLGHMALSTSGFIRTPTLPDLEQRDAAYGKELRKALADLRSARGACSSWPGARRAAAVS